MLLDANMARDHLAMLGTDITLSATIKGVPTPTVSWKKNDGDVPSHITIAVTPTGSKVFIPKSIRADSGNYTITVENAAGRKSATVAVLVLSECNIHRHKNSTFLVLEVRNHFLRGYLNLEKLKFDMNSFVSTRQAVSSQRPGDLRGDQ